MTSDSTNPLLARDERIAQLEAEVEHLTNRLARAFEEADEKRLVHAEWIASLTRDLQYVDHDFALTKAAHVKAVDELVELRRELELRDRLLSLAQGTLAHLEHGIKEHRRVEQNITTDALIAHARKEAV